MQAMRLHCAREGFERVRTFPAGLPNLLYEARIDALAFGLLPFGKGKIGRIAHRRVEQSLRHGPPMFEVKVAGNSGELGFEEGHLPRRHCLGVDAAPHAMRMAAAFFFMEDNRARLAFQIETIFDPAYGLLKVIDGDSRISGRRQ